MISISAAPWVLWTWVPAGLLSVLAERQVLLIVNRQETGQAVSIGLSFEGLLLASLLGWLVAMRLIFAPPLLIYAYILYRRRTKTSSSTLPPPA